VKPDLFSSLTPLLITCKLHVQGRKLYRDGWLSKTAQNFRTLGNTLSGAEFVGKGLDKATSSTGCHFTIQRY